MFRISDPDIRLENNFQIQSGGQIRVKENGVWGNICIDGFGSIEADVACRMLGYHSG